MAIRPIGDAAGAARGRFATTQWSLVLSAAGRGSSDGAEALARLCGLYWFPLYAFVRRQGHSSDEAQDLTQGFFAQLIEKRSLAAADRTRGRFRTFLLAACRNFLANERDRATALKRGGGKALVSIDAADAEARFARAFAHDATPDVVYDRQWSRAILAAGLDALRASYAAAGHEAVFDRLSGFLTADTDAGTHEEAARDLGMTPGAVKVAVHRLRRRYRAAVRARVAETVESEDQIEGEMEHLLATLSGAGGPGNLSGLPL